MKIYTKTGDRGITSLIGGKRVPKTDSRVEAYGTVDELSAFLAFLRDGMEPFMPALDEYRSDILVILNNLMDIEAVLAMGDTPQAGAPLFGEDKVSYLEKRIDAMSCRLKPAGKFILPGGHPVVSLAHICRTVCRRAEREACRADCEFEVEENVLKYLNRLSDYLYLLGRTVSDILDVKEEFWTPARRKNK